MINSGEVTSNEITCVQVEQDGRLAARWIEWDKEMTAPSREGRERPAASPSPPAPPVSLAGGVARSPPRQSVWLVPVECGTRDVSDVFLRGRFVFRAGPSFPWWRLSGVCVWYQCRVVSRAICCARCEGAVMCASLSDMVSLLTRSCFREFPVEKTERNVIVALNVFAELSPTLLTPCFDSAMLLIKFPFLLSPSQEKNTT